MDVDLGTPRPADLGEVLRTLASWQREASPLQLHPGDLGWWHRHGARATAAALRTWRAGGRLLALGLLDGPDVLRLTVAPGTWEDEDLAREVVADLSDPRRGVLPAGEVSVESPDGSALQSALDRAGWRLGEPWTPLRRDLGPPVEQVSLDVEVVGPEEVAAFTAVHRSAWSSERFTDGAWRTMASGPTYGAAWCLLGRDEHGTAVAGITVWSAGPGRPALVEPLGVHRDHRHRGYGAAICVAAAAAAREAVCSSVQVCTTTANTAAVATYRAAGFEEEPRRLDRVRRFD